MRPSETATLENPLPKPLIFHVSCGSCSCHEDSKPVSADRPSRLGPRQVDQLPLAASFFASGEGSPSLANRLGVRRAEMTIEMTIQRIGKILIMSKPE